MKQNKIFSVILLAVAVLFAACSDNPPLYPTGIAEPQPQVEAPDTIGWDIPSWAITVAEACSICSELGQGGTTDSAFYVKGYISELHSNNSSGITGNYHNAQFYMADDINGNGLNSFIAYRVKGIGKSDITDLSWIQVGDYVVVYGQLTNYGGTYETVQNSYIWNSTNIALKIPPYRRGELSITSALDSLEYLAIGDTTQLTVRGYVNKAVVDTVTGAAACTLTDGTYELSGYDIRYIRNADFVSEEQLKHGDVVSIQARITKDTEDNNTPKIISGNITRTSNTYRPE